MTNDKKRKSRLPTLKSREEKLTFRDTHNFSDYMKKLTPVQGTGAKHMSKGRA